MKAIILAAGYATRLSELAQNIPKALLPIHERPIIDFIIEQVETLPAIDHIYVVSNHKFITHFEEWFKAASFRIPVTVLDDGTTSKDNRLGAIGDIHFAIESASIDDDLLVVCGDNFFTYSLLDYYAFFEEKQSDCVCVKQLSDQKLLRQFGVAVLDENQKLLSVVEKPDEPASDMAVFATYMYRRETVPLFSTYLSAGNNPDAPGYFVEWLYPRKDVYGYIMQGDCYDIGTPESYAEVCALFSQNG